MSVKRNANNKISQVCKRRSSNQLQERRNFTECRTAFIQCNFSSYEMYKSKKGFCSMKRLGVFLLPLDGILVHHRLPSSILSGRPQSNLLCHLYTWIERGTVRVKCFA